MLGESITITRNAVANVLPRINNDNFNSTYLLRTATEEFRVNVRHSVESARAGVVPYERHNFEYIHTTFATLTAPEKTEISSTTIRCRRGDDPADALKTAQATRAYLVDAVLTKLIAWES